MSFLYETCDIQKTPYQQYMKYLFENYKCRIPKEDLDWTFVPPKFDRNKYHSSRFVKITLKHGSDRHTLTIDPVHEVKRVIDLQEKIREITGVLITNQSLFYKGQKLHMHPELPLLTYNFPNEISISVGGSQHPPFVKTRRAQTAIVRDIGQLCVEPDLNWLARRPESGSSKKRCPDIKCCCPPNTNLPKKCDCNSHVHWSRYLKERPPNCVVDLNSPRTQRALLQAAGISECPNMDMICPPGSYPVLRPHSAAPATRAHSPPPTTRTCSPSPARSPCRSPCRSPGRSPARSPCTSNREDNVVHKKPCKPRHVSPCPNVEGRRRVHIREDPTMRAKHKNAGNTFFQEKRVYY
ncbi:hypothetical protein SNEBB_009601 [Seison nebaliae]|nr:hypothetical protein SNEBB_009601 [Seison nebaliae]